MRSFLMPLAMALLGFSEVAWSQAAGAPNPDFMPAEVIAQVAFIEQHPFDPHATELRPQLYQWVALSPKVEVAVCDSLFPLVERAKEPLAKALLTQALVGNAAYQLTHPKAGSVEAQMAGLESMLRTYAIVRAKSDMTNAFADALTVVRKEAGAEALRQWTCAPGTPTIP